VLSASTVGEETSNRTTSELLRRVEEQGFAIIPRVLTHAEVTSLVEDLAQLAGRRRKAGVRHVLGHVAVAELAREPRMLAIARGILGNGALPFRATLFDKSPNSNWLVVWHQDTALPLREQRDTPGWGPWSVKEGVVYAHAPESALSCVLALRVHLDDSTAENGPLRVLPGTHTLGVLSDDEVHVLATKILPVDCLVPQGGVLAIRPLLVHSSSKSHVQAARRVLHIEYSVSERVAEDLELAVA
jgi:ectoine hydroxylase-related dioxygenase (phytanoyl-CoA dioxygenase family)